MAIKVVSISELFDKDLFASPGQKLNVRSGPGAYSTVLLTKAGGERIGTVSTYAKGKDAKGNDDGSIWLQLKETYKNPSGFGAWIKYMPNAFDWKSLKEQGAKTVEEKEAEQKEKDKSGLDKVTDFLSKAGVWILGAYVLVNYNKKK